MSSDKKREPIPASIVAQYTLVVVGIIAASLFVWQIRDALLVAFAGVILATVITGIAYKLRQLVPFISRPWSLAAVGIILILFISSFGLIFGPQIVEEFEALTNRLPQQIMDLQESVREWPLGEQLLDGGLNSGTEGNTDESNNGNNRQGGETNGQGNSQTGNMSGAMLLEAGTTFVDILGIIVVTVFIGIFFAVDPVIYKTGLTLLVTKKRVDRVSEALEVSANALWQWLTGQFISMAFVGISIIIGLSIIGVPLALLLGLIAGLFDFVPYAGPIAAFLPAILLAFSEDPQSGLLTALLYLVVQQLEGNVVTPLIQHQKVYLPPAVVILSIVAFGVIFGVPGVILATPLAVITMVLVGMLYVQDVLGKDIQIPGQE
ncbi:MAG: AI-2E family transporter [Balneolaceae bacterium]